MTKNKSPLVIHIIPYMRSFVSGPTHSVWNLFKYSRINNSEIWALDFKVNVRDAKSIRYFKKQFHWRVGFSYSFFINIIKVLKIEEVIIHNHGLWMIQSLFPLLVKNKKAKIIQSPRGAFSEISMKRGGFVKKIFFSLLQKPALKRVDIFHATSREEKKQIQNLGFNQPIFILPNGVELNFKNNSFKKQSNIFIYLGRFHPEKNIELLIKCWKNFSNNHKLKLYGEGSFEYVKSLKKIIKSENIKNIEFCSPVYDLEKKSVIESCKAMLFPSLSENFGVVIAEVLAMGKPVLCTKGTPWEDINEYNAGFCVNGDFDSFSNGIQNLIKISSKDYNIMCKNALNLIEKKYMWKSLGLKYRNIIYEET